MYRAETPPSDDTPNRTEQSIKRERERTEQWKQLASSPAGLASMRRASRRTPTVASSAVDVPSTAQKAALLELYDGNFRCCLTYKPLFPQHAHCVKRTLGGPALREIEWRLGFEPGEWDINATDNVFYLAGSAHETFDKPQPKGMWTLVPDEELFDRVESALLAEWRTIKHTNDKQWPPYTTTLPNETSYNYQFVPFSDEGHFDDYGKLDAKGRSSRYFHEDWQSSPFFFKTYLHPYVVICKAVSQFACLQEDNEITVALQTVYDKLLKIKGIWDQRPAPKHVLNIDNNERLPTPEPSDTASSKSGKREHPDAPAPPNKRPRGTAGNTRASGSGNRKGRQSDGKQHGRTRRRTRRRGALQCINCRESILPCPAKPKDSLAARRRPHVCYRVYLARPRFPRVDEWVKDVARQPYLYRPTYDPIFHRPGDKEEPRGPLYLPWLPDWEWATCFLHNETFTSNDWAYREGWCNLTAPVVPKNAKMVAV